MATFCQNGWMPTITNPDVIPHEVNIARMTVGREKEHGRNIILLNTDNMISKDLLKTVQQLDYIDDAMALVFPHYADI